MLWEFMKMLRDSFWSKLYNLVNCCFFQTTDLTMLKNVTNIRHLATS